MSDQKTPFWSYLSNKPQLNDDEMDSAIELIQRGRLAYGVGYEWIFEPNKVAVEWPHNIALPRYGGNYFWHGQDHLFVGVGYREVKQYYGNREGDDVSLEEDNYLERVDRFKERIFPNPTYGVLPSSKDLEGNYDILYYAAEYHYLLRHHRTARGTLTLSCVPSGEEDDNGTTVLQGRVEMGPSQNLDRIPHGSNFTFVETNRYQRIVVPKEHGTDNVARAIAVHSAPTVAGVIQIQVSKAPEGTLEMRYGRVAPNEFRGEFKQLRHKVALGLQQDCPLPWDDDTAHRRCTIERNAEQCLEENRLRKETCLLWMRRHILDPSLPPEVLYRIQELVSPPPYLILEPGDWVLNIDWSGGLPSYSANSCLVVRKRR